MDALVTFLEILKFTIPALIVFGVVYFLMKQHFKHSLHAEQVKQMAEKSGSSIPVQLQAYERLVLFCERIGVENMMMRVGDPNMTANELKITLMLTLQKEYEHNISQQIYVSSQLWQIVNIAKENVLDIVNAAATQVDKNAPAVELQKKIYELVSQEAVLPYQRAQEAIRKEASTLFH